MLKEQPPFIPGVPLYDRYRYTNQMPTSEPLNYPGQNAYRFGQPTYTTSANIHRGEPNPSTSRYFDNPYSQEPYPSNKSSKLNSVNMGDIMDKIRKWNVKFDKGQDALSFLERVEELANCYGIHYDMLLIGLPEMLTKSALLWYRNNREKWFTWEQFVTDFKSHFLPARYELRLYDEIRRCVQKQNEKAKDFITSIQSLMRWQKNMTPYEKINRTYENLLPEYKLYIKPRDFVTLEDLENLCDEYELVREQERKMRTKPEDLRIKKPFGGAYAIDAAAQRQNNDNNSRGRPVQNSKLTTSNRNINNQGQQSHRIDNHSERNVEEVNIDSRRQPSQMIQSQYNNNINRQQNQTNFIPNNNVIRQQNQEVRLSHNNNTNRQQNQPFYPAYMNNNNNGPQNQYNSTQCNNFNTQQQSYNRPENSNQNSYSSGNCCWKCGQQGHTRRGCLNRPKYFCYYCGKEGILARNCNCRGQTTNETLPTPSTSNNQMNSVQQEPVEIVNIEATRVSTVDQDNKIPKYTVPIQILNTEFTALIDTGAVKSFIGEKVYNYLQINEVESIECDMPILLANSSMLQIETAYKLKIYFCGKEISHIFYYMPSLSENILVGLDLLTKVGAQVSVFGKELQLYKAKPVQVFAIDTPPELTEEQIREFNEFLEKYFTKFDEIDKPTQVLKHKIRMKDDEPFKQRYYPRNPAMQTVINEIVDNLIKENKIEPSNSPYSSPIVLVKKKDGTWRMCVDYRQLNAQSIKDAYPLPYINFMLDKLRGAQYISTIDLKHGYWQVPLEETSKQYTAFTVPGRGLFQWKVLPFGIHSAPATFQRLLDTVIGPEMEPYASSYLDDIIVVSKTFEEHKEKLAMVFDKLYNSNLKINTEKSQFLKTELKYLGHTVSRRGIETDSDKVKAISALPAPKTIREVRRFLGMASWYRRFINSFSETVAPITKLLHKNIKWQWTEKQQEAFELIKKKLTEAPVLISPDFSMPFVLQTDASNEGLGVVLCQDIDGKECVVAYASKTLNELEKKYSVTEKECLAVLWGIRKMRPYLEGYHFTVVTDHQALKWLHNLDNPSGRLARWAIEMQQYDFEVKYRRGKLNVVADLLSRQPIEHDETFEVFAVDTPEVEKYQCVWYNNKIKEVKEKPEANPDFNIIEEKLYRHFLSTIKFAEDDTGPDWKLCIPTELRNRVLRENHDEVTAGHLGIRKTIARIAKYYYWPRMFKDIVKYVRSCESCIKYKPVQQAPAGKMYSQQVSEPWDIVCSDFIGPLPRSTKGNTMILVFQDKFTKWTEFVAVRQATSSVLVKSFKERIIARNGTPRIFLSDNGTQYTSHIFKKVLKQFNVEHRFTAPYSPQANPTERVNRVIKTMISQYVKEDHRTWDDNLPELMLAINSSHHESTGYTPAFLNYGREIKIPQTLYDENVGDQAALDPEGNSKRMKKIFQIVKINLKNASQKQSYHYNLRRRAWCPNVGDFVYRKERNISSKVKNFNAKLAPKYEGPFEVVSIISPVVVKIKNQTSKVETAHVKDLKPFHNRQ